MAEHKSIAAAIAATMASVTRLQKTETNKHGGYKYAGVEAFLDHLRPKMAENGLSVVQACVASDVIEGMYVGRYEFTLLHASGQLGPYQQVGMANAKMGAQAVGAAQSYALKFFLRGLFMVSADEDAAHDVDAQDQQPLSEGTGRKKKQADPLEELKREAYEAALVLCGGSKADAIDTLRATAARLNLGNLNELDAAGVQAVIDDLTGQEAA